MIGNGNGCYLDSHKCPQLSAQTPLILRHRNTEHLFRPVSLLDGNESEPCIERRVPLDLAKSSQKDFGEFAVPSLVENAIYECPADTAAPVFPDDIE